MSGEMTDAALVAAGKPMSREQVAVAAKTAYDTATEVEAAIELFARAEAEYVAAARAALSAARSARHARLALQRGLSATFRVAMDICEQLTGKA